MPEQLPLGNICCLAPGRHSSPGLKAWGFLPSGYKLTKIIPDPAKFEQFVHKFGGEMSEEDIGRFRKIFLEPDYLCPKCNHVIGTEELAYTKKGEIKGCLYCLELGKQAELAIYRALYEKRKKIDPSCNWTSFKATMRVFVEAKKRAIAKKRKESQLRGNKQTQGRV